MLKWVLTARTMRQTTLKQRRFILAYVKNGGNRTQAALEAYDTTYATARVIGCENLTKPNIKREIDRLTEAVSLSTRDCLRAIRDAFYATDKNGYPDHRTRLKAAVLAIKIRGGYPEKQVSHDHRHSHIHQTVMKELSEMPYDELVSLIHEETARGEILELEAEEDEEGVHFVVD